MKKKLKGFTLVELIIVMALMTALMLMVGLIMKPISQVFADTTRYTEDRYVMDGMAAVIDENLKYADKICVDEETVRLRSHIEHAKKCLLEDGGIGRKMDFIAQEMNREANTTLSKANDIDISNAAIDLKTEIEKIREQIQNIE